MIRTVTRTLVVGAVAWRWLLRIPPTPPPVDPEVLAEERRDEVRTESWIAWRSVIVLVVIAAALTLRAITV